MGKKGDRNLLNEIQMLRECLREHRNQEAWSKAGRLQEQYPYCSALLVIRGIAAQLMECTSEDVLPDAEASLSLAAALQEGDLYAPNEYAYFLHSVQDNSQAALPVFEKSIIDLMALLKEALKGKHECLKELGRLEECEILQKNANRIFPEGIAD